MTGLATRTVHEFPASSAQRRQWVLQQRDLSSTAYVMPVAARLRGPLDIAAVRTAVAELLGRHEVLRTSFALRDGELWQQVHDSVPTPVEVRSGFDEHAAHADVQAEIRRPFDLAVAPLLRVVVWRLGEADHVLLMVAHHVALDGWSVRLLLREFADRYAARAAGRVRVEGERGVQPADHAAWEATRWTETTRESHLAHWRAALAGAPTERLVPDTGAAPAERGRAARVHRPVDPVTTARLPIAAREHSVTELTVLLAGLVGTLHRFTGRRDCVVGLPVTGRKHPQLAAFVGCLVNTLPVRIRWDGTPTGHDLIALTRTALHELIRHEDVPVDVLAATVATDGRELFDVLFQLEDDLPLQLLPGLDTERIDAYPAHAKAALTCTVLRSGTALAVSWEHDLGRVGSETVAAIADAFDAVLRALVTDTSAAVDDLSSAVDETDDVGPRPSAPAGTIPELFDARVSAAPDTVAIIDGDRRTTYGELAAASRDLAGALASAGVTAHDPVGVYLSRGADFAVAALAALRLGAYYVPLNPADPPDRTARIVSDAHLAHAVCGTADSAPGDATRWIAADAAGPHRAPHPAQPDDLCLRVHTSGSTGQPKGVGITHRAVVDLTVPGDWFDGDAATRMLWVSAVSFDVLTWELWGTLLNGGTGVICPDHGFEPATLGRLIREHGVTTALLTPALFNAVVDTDVELLAGLRTLCVGGEALSARHIRVARRALPTLRLVNAYGPAEATTIATSHSVGDDVVADVPIGRAITGMRVALRRDGRPIPRGAVGEVWLGGTGLARGYVGRPGLTAERFVPGKDGARWYRTGDLAHRDAAGALHFHGRDDAQVQIRGHRVEPAEVAAALSRQPGVARAAVVPREVGTNDVRLAAYVVATGDLDVDELREALRRQLPGYLVPAWIVVLDRLPLTSNGKLATADLPEPTVTPSHRAATTPTEHLVAAAWAEALRCEAAALGGDDDFFACGGHSLLAAAVAARLRTDTGRDVSLQTVFEQPVLADLAATIDALPATQRADESVRVAPRPAPLSTAQRRVWFLTQLDPDSTAYTIPLTVELHGALDVRALRDAVQWLVARHEALRCVVSDTGDDDVQSAVPAEDAHVLRVLDVTAHADPYASWQRLLRRDIERPFALADRELPVRVLLVRFAADRYGLAVLVHHLVADAWSVGVLADDLSHAYAAFHAGGAPKRPALPLQFPDFAAHERRRSSDPAVAEGVDHWARALADIAPTVDLPTSRIRPAVRGTAGAVLPWAADSALTAEVRALATAHGCTEFMVLLAAFGVAVGGWSGQSTFVVGTPTARRDDATTHPVVGYFADTLPVPVDLSGDPTVAELLERVRAACVDSYAHADVPFERIVERLSIERDLSRTPLFQVMLSLDTTERALLTLPDVDVEVVPTDVLAARTDLTLALTDRGDRIDGICEYATDLFDLTDAARLVESYRGVLAAFVSDTDRRIGELASAATPRRGSEVADGAVDTEARALDDVEKSVAAVWSAVLSDHPQVIAAQANFFALGGQSFLAARVASRLSRELGTAVPVRAVFEHPTVAGLAEVVRGTAGPVDAPVPLPPAIVEAPLTFEQERLWFLTQLDPDSVAYHIPLVATLRGALDRSALRAAVDAIVARHESLRTTYHSEPDGAVQHVHAASDLPPEFTFEDVRGADDPRQRADDLVRETVWRPYDLAAGVSPVRVLVARTEADEHVVALTVHHLAADGVAVGTLVRELGAAYTALCSGSAPESTPPPLRYLDYAAWQRGRDHDQRLAAAVARRADALAGAPHELDLPRGAQAPGHARGHSIPVELPAGVTAAVHELAAEANSTTFAVLFAAFGLVLARYGGHDDVLVGTPVANRDVPGIEDLVGLLANTAVLRATVRGPQTVREYLGRARRECVAALADAHVPFSRLVERLCPDRDRSRTPLVQAMIAFNATPTPPLHLPQLVCTPRQPDNPTAKFDLLLNLADDGGVLRGVCEYDTGRHDLAFVTAFVAAVTRTLAAFAADPDAPLTSIAVEDSGERCALAQVLDGGTAAGSNGHLADLVERSVARTPDAVAVINAADGTALTYRELDAAADRLSRALVLRGIGPDTPVGVCLPRSPELVIAEYAVLKSGGAFLPIDPAWPAARIRQVVSDAGCPVVVARGSATRRFSDDTAVLDPSDGVDADGVRAPRRAATTAYLICTSGSTGQPKTVEVPHAAISNNLLWMQRDWPLDPRDRLLHKCSSAFDVSVKEIFWPLIAGAQIVLAEPGSERDPVMLLDALDAHAITVCHLVPSVLELVLDEAAASERRLGSVLRLVMCGAETLSPATCRRFASASIADLLHLYGPTETAIAVTGWLRSAEESVRTTVPLGRPMPNCRLRILDADLVETPRHAWGELYISGIPLARGYRSRPSATAMAFLPDERGERMYRTGDRVRVTADGVLEFGGRVDNQVKIRGLRVELGEVESVMRTCAGVARAAVVVQGCGGDAHLVGFMVADRTAVGSDAHDVGDCVRHDLAAQLPAHMVPAQVIVLDELPLNANGKIDRGALTERAADLRTTRAPDRMIVPPRDETERVVADVWSSVLGVAVGVDDDYFALGGQSLQVAQIVAELRTHFDTEVRVSDLFEKPTVATLSELLRAAPASEQPTPIRRRARRPRTLESTTGTAS